MVACFARAKGFLAAALVSGCSLLPYQPRVH
jgi:hypothetical protein